MMRRSRDRGEWFSPSGLPTLRPEKVSPESALRLHDSTNFVVVDTEDGGHTFHIKSQHRSEKAAKMARKSFPLRCAVYRVVREETK